MEAPVPDRIGRYAIVGVLGKGAMGTVYRARDLNLDREVAVKVMTAGEADDDARARFLREGKAAARFQHPNIVTIYELGEHQGQPFMALELLDGMDLQRAIEGGLRPDPKYTLPIVLHLLAGLGHAHEHGIVHRDVKPSNLFLPKGRPAKIMDFGVARLVGTHTSTGLVIGTPNYMSPEQVKAADLDGRSDLFSAGLILFELVTGEKAYKADSVVTLLFKIAHEAPNFDLIPKGARWERLRVVLRRALERDKDARYPDAAAMAAGVEGALRELGGFFDPTAGAEQAFVKGATPRPQPQPTFVAPPTQAEPRAKAPDLAGPRDAYAPTVVVEPAEPETSRKALLLGGGLGVLAVLILAAAVVLLMRSPGPPTAPAPTPSATALAGAPPPAPVTSPTTAPRPAPPGATTPLAPATPTPRVARPADAPAATETPTAEAARPPAGVSRTEARLDRANDLMEKGRYAQALAEARAVLEREPTNAEASALAGDAEAAILIEDSVKKARAALKAGDKEAALVEIKKGLAANPSEGRLLALFREARQ